MKTAKTLQKEIERKEQLQSITSKVVFAGLWVVNRPESHKITQGKYEGFYIKGVKITKNEVPLIELWNDKEEVITLRDC